MPSAPAGGVSLEIFTEKGIGTMIMKEKKLYYEGERFE
jgi:hypothetical protein